MPDNPEFLLSYSIPAAEKDDFLKFVKEGKKKPDGSFEKDKNGNKMTGVIAWLKKSGLEDTKIYTAEKDGNLVFIATGNSIGSDWSQIPGFFDLFKGNTRVPIDNKLNELLAPKP